MKTKRLVMKKSGFCFFPVPCPLCGRQNSKMAPKTLCPATLEPLPLGFTVSDGFHS